MATRGDHPDLRVEAKASDRSLGELFAELTTELGSLVRTEIELAKTETKDELKKAGKAGGLFGGAGIEAHFALLFLSFALVWLLNEAMHIAVAFVIVAVLHGLGAYLLYTRARSNRARVEPLPQTMGSLKENV